MSIAHLWQAKLFARLHDPAEKALILMRTAEGHEGGTSRSLIKELFPDGMADGVKDAVRKADHWSSAADRAAFPKHDKDGRYPAWQNVRFHEKPVIIHPLTGAEYDLGKLDDIDVEDIKQRSLGHFRGLIQRDDPVATAHAFWRFGPSLADDELKSLWGVLPADTRVPDHSIWDHLDLTSALAGAFALDPEQTPALLAVSLGPVQAFIAEAQSTSDLWAGSHLLSQMAWQAMRVICEELGPDAVLFPRLRGVPQVDLWLRDQCGVDATLFEQCEWVTQKSDHNPLFVASLPNRFTAVVPASRARELAETITTRVQQWVREQAEDALAHLLEAAGIEDSDALPAHVQIREQLAGFPQVHWASVPWSLVGQDSKGKVDASDTRLAEAMQPFFQSSPAGFLGSEAWGLLSGGVELEDGWFWKPNPGTLYPALHELLERALASIKATRPFAQTTQQGWRDNLGGEYEWLTADRDDLRLPPGQRKDTLWTRVAATKPAWAGKGAHLDARNTLKRLWPTLFVEHLGAALDRDLGRFVVSTHAMALAGTLAHVDPDTPLPDELAGKLDAGSPRVALPRKTYIRLQGHPERERLLRLPGWFDAEINGDDEAAAAKARSLLGRAFGCKPETYYALLLMDGDRMGAWLSASREFTLAHEACFHPHIRASARARFGRDDAFMRYCRARRAANPARHMAISEALNNFALTLAPMVVERQHHGRVLYAGGDDLMAMLPVGDLLSAMAALRAAYSGVDPEQTGGLPTDATWRRQKSGFVRYRDRLLRLMGEQATASIGAVIAHHKAPLSRTLRELRKAESRAKSEGGRDAFSITVIKRSGGALNLDCKWSRESGVSPMTCLRELAGALRAEQASRRAAYNVQAWTPDLPEPAQLGDDAYRRMLAQLFAHQFDRQGLTDAGTHADRLAELAPLDSQKDVVHFVNNFLSVAEFLAREGRATGEPA